MMGERAVEIGRRVTHYRKLRGIAQEDLARLANVRLGTVNRIEGGKNTPRLETLERLAIALGVDINDLLQGRYRSPGFRAPLGLVQVSPL